MDKTTLQEFLYDIERAKNWDTIHNLIMDYANEENGTSENDFDEEWWDDFTNSIEHGEILNKELFFPGL